MASFDAETFFKVTGETGTGFFDAVGMAYGLPSCMLNTRLMILHSGYSNG